MKIAALLISLCFASGVFANTAKNNFEVTFGVIDESSGYQDVKKETKTIERRDKSEGYRYGFKIIPSHGEFYRCYTVTYLPSVPKSLSGTIDSTEREKYASGFKSPETQEQGSIIVPFWFDEGDPVGVYKTDLYIDGIKIRTEEYQVVAKR